MPGESVWPGPHPELKVCDPLTEHLSADLVAIGYTEATDQHPQFG